MSIFKLEKIMFLILLEKNQRSTENLLKHAIRVLLTYILYYRYSYKFKNIICSNLVDFQFLGPFFLKCFKK